MRINRAPIGSGRRPDASRRAPIPLLALGALAALVAVLPFFYLADRAIERGWSATWDELWQRRTWDLIVRSVALTTVVTVMCVLIGVFAAVLIARTDLPGRRMWHSLLVIPLAVPSYLAAYAWVAARPSLAGFWGAALVLTTVSYPYVYLPVATALRRVDPALEEMARSLGRSRARSLLVSVQQVRATISAGALLVALYVSSDFGAVATMRYEAFTWVIYGAYRAGFNPTRAAVLALVLVALATVLVVAESYARGAASRLTTSRAGREGRRVALGSAATGIATVFMVGVSAVSVGFPIASFGYWLSRGAARDVAASDVMSAFAATMGVSALAAVATVLLALPVGLLAARHRSPLVTALERSTYIAHALPGIVIAISMVYVGVKVLEPIYLRTPLLVLAYAVLFLPLAVGSTRAAIEQSPRQLEDVARSLGRTRWGTWRDVTAPLAAPGIAAGAALVMVTAMKELPITLLLHPTGMETMSMAVWKHTAVSDYANAAPYAVALITSAILPTIALSRLVAHDRRGTMS
ncbi:MAG: ABC transporter permease [Acidimicrobiia bacterium]